MGPAWYAENVVNFNSTEYKDIYKGGGGTVETIKNAKTCPELVAGLKMKNWCKWGQRPIKIKKYFVFILIFGFDVMLRERLPAYGFLSAKDLVAEVAGNISVYGVLSRDSSPDKSGSEWQQSLLTSYWGRRGDRSISV